MKKVFKFFTSSSGGGDDEYNKHQKPKTHEHDKTTDIRSAKTYLHPDKKFQDSTSATTLKSDNTDKETQVVIPEDSDLGIGVPLEECRPSQENPFVPAVLSVCTKLVEKHGLMEPGIYQIHRDVTETRRTVAKVMTNDEQEFEGNVHLLANAVKLFFRCLPNGRLMGSLQKYYNLNELFTKDKKRFMQQLKSVIHSFPRHNFKTLHHISLHLLEVSKHRHINRMNLEKLCFIFGPILFSAENLVKNTFCQADILESIVVNCEWYFGPMDEELSTECSSALNENMIEIDLHYLDMPIEKRRRIYHCKKMYVTLDQIPTWTKFKNPDTRPGQTNEPRSSYYTENTSLNEKVSLWFGDITLLEVDCIVNAPFGPLDDADAGKVIFQFATLTSTSTGLSEAILFAGGPVLKNRLSGLTLTSYADTLITAGFCLPARYILHVRSPHRFIVQRNAETMRRCYTNCLECAKRNGLKSIAFPCLSTGGKGLPALFSASIALRGVREWLDREDNLKQFDRVIFCVFDKHDMEEYKEQMPLVFPRERNTVPVNIPMEILNMDDRAVELYQMALKKGKENVYNIRLMVIGPYGVGKTTLTNRLLQTGSKLEDIQSTNSVDVHVRKCAVSVPDGKWMFKEEKDAEFDDFHLRMAKILTSYHRKEEAHPKEESSPERNQEISENNNKAANENVLLRNLSTNEDVHLKTVPPVFDYIDPSSVLSAFHVTFESSNALKMHKEDLVSENVFLTRYAISEMLNKIQKNSVQIKKQTGGISVWDFGGQFVFYSTHQAFLSPRAIYLVVMDISKGLLDEIKDDDCFIDFHGCKYLKNGENLVFWLNSIHTYGSSKEGGGPPVILVATHLDKLQGNKESEIDTFFDEIRSLLRHNKDILKHLTDVEFGIDNTIQDPNLQQLRMKIFQIASKQRYWGEEIPATWTTLERSLSQRKNEGAKILSFKEIQDIDSQRLTPLGDEEELDLFLKFQNSLGNVIYYSEEQFRNYIILEPQWLIDAFKCLITGKQFCTRDPDVVDKWFEFNEHGILRKELVEAVWTRAKGQKFYEYKEHLLCLMEKLDIIVKPVIYCDESEDDVRRLDYHFAPCMLKETVSEDYIVKITQEASRTPYLCYCFDNNFLPPAIFHRLLAACLSKWSVACQKKKLLLFCGCVVFDIDKSNRLVMCMHNNIIQVSVYRYSRNREIPEQNLCMEVRHVVEMTLQTITHRYQQQLPFTAHMKCSLSSFLSSEGLLPVNDLMCNPSVACHNHNTRPSHSIESIELVKCWFSHKELEHLHEISGATSRSQLCFGESDRCPTELELSRIARKIGKEYTQLGILLGVDYATIEQIQLSYPTDIAEQCFKILVKWKQKFPTRCTLADLECSMRELDLDLHILYDSLVN